MAKLEYKLFQKAGVRVGRDERPGDLGKRIKIHWSLRALPYNVDGAFSDLTRLLLAIRELESHFSPRAGPRTWLMTATPTQSQPAYFAIDCFMMHVRRAQNALVRCARRGLPHGGALPTSMAHLAKGLEKGSYEVPDGFRNTILDYWHNHGCNVKRYRDIGEHYGVIWSYASFGLLDGKPAVSIRLPSPEDDPNSRRLRFTHHEIQAQPFVMQEFEALVDVVNEVVNALLASLPGRDGSIIGYAGRWLNVTEGYTGMDQEEVTEYATSIVERVRAMPVREWDEA